MNKIIWILSLALFSLSADAKKPPNNAEKPFCSTQILTHKIKGGRSWSLATRLGKFLLQAEKEYGPRNQKWTILGIEFATEGPPNIWYPFSKKESNFIAVQLTNSAANNKKKALFQLAHETIHLLSPIGPGQKSSVLEEGLAAYFSIHALADSGVKIKATYINSKPYTQAYILVSKLYKEHKDTSARIKKLRAKGYTLSNISSKVLIQHFPNITTQHANLLTRRFDTLK